MAQVGRGSPAPLALSARRIPPPTVLPAHILERANLTKTGFFVGSNGSRMLDSPDNRNHLPNAGTLTSAHQRVQ